MCLLVWCILAYCNPRNMLIRAKHIQGCLNVTADILSRKEKVIQTDWSLHPQTSTLCFTSPRCSCTEHRWIEHLVGGTGWLYLLSCSTHSKSHSKNEHLHWFWDLVNLSTKPHITATSLASSVETTFQSEISSEPVVSEPSCLAPRYHSESLESFSEQVAERIKTPQRPLSRKLYESRWAILELWCQQNKVVSSEPTISNTADYFNYLFTIKNLKPATIAGYRMAIADQLLLFGQEVSKSLDLNRLIVSFYRDKCTANRGISSWKEVTISPSPAFLAKHQMAQICSNQSFQLSNHS